MPGKQKESAICCNVWLVHTKGNGELKYDRRHMRTRICFSLYSLLFHNHHSIGFFICFTISFSKKCNKMDRGEIKMDRWKMKQKSSLERRLWSAFYPTILDRQLWANQWSLPLQARRCLKSIQTKEQATNCTQWFLMAENPPKNKFTWCDFTNFSKDSHYICFRSLHALHIKKLSHFCRHKYNRLISRIF